MVVEINAITFVVRDMTASVAFYETAGLPVVYGGAAAPFTSLGFGPANFINLVVDDTASPGFWGRVVLHVDDPDALCATFRRAGYESLTEPADAPWGERYFHIRDPDGHELSFARRLEPEPR